MSKDGPVRLIIDFKNRAALADWVESQRDVQIGSFPPNVGAFELDGLDKGAISQGDTYILRRIGDRDDRTRLAVTETEVTKRKI
jgi:hypothetical protein